MDPLSLIRQYNASGLNIKYSDGSYIFGKKSFSESTKTAFRKNAKGNFDSNSIYIYFCNQNLILNQYLYINK